MTKYCTELIAGEDSPFSSVHRVESAGEQKDWERKGGTHPDFSAAQNLSASGSLARTIVDPILSA